MSSSSFLVDAKKDTKSDKPTMQAKPNVEDASQDIKVQRIVKEFVDSIVKKMERANGGLEFHTTKDLPRSVFEAVVKRLHDTTFYRAKIENVKVICSHMQNDDTQHDDCRECTSGHVCNKQCCKYSIPPPEWNDATNTSIESTKCMCESTHCCHTVNAPNQTCPICGAEKLVIVVLK
jgi:hypothetical protein